MLSPHTPTVSKRSSLFCAVKSPRCLLVGAFSMGITEPNPKSLPQLLISNASKPARLVIAPFSSKHSKRPTGRSSRCSSVWAQGSRASLSLFISGEAVGGSNVLAPFPRCMSVFCLAAVTEKRHISTRSVSFHTHFLSQTRALRTERCALQGWEFSPLCLYLLLNVDRPLDLDVGLWQD